MYNEFCILLIHVVILASYYIILTYWIKEISEPLHISQIIPLRRWFQEM